MNQSSLFSFDETSVWDPKIIRKHLIIPEDQLAKLDSIPGWTKVQDNRNTQQFDKDFSIESSQSECCVNVTENSQRIEKNTELFNEQVKNRKLILKTYKVYGKKLTRSLSLFTIDKSYENSLNCRTLKRTLSLQSVCQASDVSDLNNHQNSKSESSDKKNNYKLSDSEAQNSAILFLSKEVNSKSMETGSQLSVINVPPVNENVNLHFEVAKKTNNKEPPENTDKKLAGQSMKNATNSVNVSTIDLHPETAKKCNGILSADADLHSEMIKENGNVLSAENVSQLNSVPGQLIKHATEFVIADNADLNSEKPKEDNSLMGVDNFDSHSNIITDSNILHAGDKDLLSETTKEDNSVLAAIASDGTAKRAKDFMNAENLVISSFNDHTDLYVPVISEKCKSDMNNIEEIPANKIATGEDAATLSAEKLLSSSLGNTNGANSIVKETVVDNVKSNSNPLQDAKQSTSIFNNEYIDSKLKSVQKEISDLKRNASVIDAAENHIYKNAAFSVEKNYDENLDKLYPSKSIATAIPSSTHVNASETKNFVENSGPDMKIKDTDSEQKECYDKMHDSTKPSAENDEPSFSKKRKLESKIKRSKRLKSEEKQGNLKIRSIKKVGEICYSVEEVKTMLDIMKQFL